MILETISGKTGIERNNLVASAFVRLPVPKTITIGNLDVEIDTIRQIDGGIELYARAFLNNKPIGFGSDGTVEFERFRFYGIPILTPSGNKITIQKSIPGVLSESYEKDIFIEDPITAFKESFAHTIKVVAKGGGDIVQGKRGNTTDTYYPSVTTADNTLGTLEKTTWATARGLSSADFVDDADLTARLYNNGNFSIERGYTGFDTSAIGSDTVTSATISLYITTKYNADNDGNDFIVPVSASPTTPSDTVAADYSTIGPPSSVSEGSADRKDITTGITTSAYNDWTLNATGLSWIDAYTSIGWMEGHDVLNDPVNSGAGTYSGIRASGSETAGTTQDPKLVVTHVAGGGGAATVKNKPTLLFMGVG